jgi:hypothetical protein
MAFQCFLDAFNIGLGAAATTVVRTGYGFQPKACLYWWSGRVESTTSFAAQNLQPGFGMATGPTSRACVTSYSQNGIGTMVTNRRHDNANVINLSTNVSTVDQLAASADLQSFDAGGQTLVITDSFSGALNIRVHCLALGGSDLTDAAVVQFVGSGTTGAQDVTVGFEPTGVVLLGFGSGTPPALTTPAFLSIGVATGASAQGVVSFIDADNTSSSNTGHYGFGGDSAASWANYLALSARAAFTTMLPTGFRVTWTGSTGQYLYALALRGGSMLVGNVVTSTTLNATIVASGLGFTPTGVFLLSSSAAQDAAGTPALQANLSLGAFTSLTSRGAQSIVSNNAANSAVCASSINEDACLRMLNSGTVSAGVVDVSAVGSDGFTLIMDVADVTTAKYVTYLAFGNSAAVAFQPMVVAVAGVTTTPNVTIAALGGGDILPQMMHQHSG